MLGRVDLTEVADELYAALPDEFVARRSELAARAKDDGDKALAAEIKKLAKPTTAAWVVNMLVRHEPDQVQQVLDLGAALREAQASMAGEELRQLGRQRRQLTAAVTREARGLAAELGQKIGESIADQVQETLHAGMVDEAAAEAVRTGMLVKPLAVTGLEASGVAESVAVAGALGQTAVRRASARPTSGRKGPEPQKPDLTVVQDSSRAVKEAEDALAEAEAELADAERRLAKAQRKVEKREAKALQMQAELEELRRRLAEVEERLEANEDELSEAEDARDEREEAVAAAKAAVEQARKRLDSVR